MFHTDSDLVGARAHVTAGLFERRDGRPTGDTVGDDSSDGILRSAEALCTWSLVTRIPVRVKTNTGRPEALTCRSVLGSLRLYYPKVPSPGKVYVTSAANCLTGSLPSRDLPFQQLYIADHDS